jgi:transposase
MILAERAARLASEIAVERLKLEVARLRRERFGTPRNAAPGSTNSNSS